MSRGKTRSKVSPAERAEAQKRKVILGISAAVGCFLLLVTLIVVLTYRHATSYETRLKQLASDDPQRVETALAALEKAGMQALPQLIQGLKGDSDQVRAHCLTLLKTLGPQAGSALNDLQDGIRSDDKSVRIACMTAIGYLGENGRPAEAVLIVLLRDSDAEIRTAASGALKSVSTPEKMVSELIKIVKEDNAALRRDAVVQLGAYGPAAKDAVPVLMNLLDGTDGPLKKLTCRSLGQIGDDRPEVLAGLKSVAERTGDDVTIRTTAVETLGALGPKAVVPLTEALQTREPIVIKSIARALGRFGSTARSAVPALQDCKTRTIDSEKTERMNIIRAEMHISRGTTTYVRKNGVTYRMRKARSFADVQADLMNPNSSLFRRMQSVARKWQDVRNAIDAAIAKIQG